jgi:YD repeat-containing protein
MLWGVPSVRFAVCTPWVLERRDLVGRAVGRPAAVPALGEPATVTEPGGVTQTSTYDELGNLTKQTGAGAETATGDRSFAYDLAGRPFGATTGDLWCSLRARGRLNEVPERIARFRSRRVGPASAGYRFPAGR